MTLRGSSFSSLHRHKPTVSALTLIQLASLELKVFFILNFPHVSRPSSVHPVGSHHGLWMPFGH